MELYKEGDKIECNKSEVIAKKITPQSLQNHPKLGRVWKYKCDRDGSAEITEELDPKEALHSEESNLNLGDTLKSEKFYVLVKETRKLRPKKIGGHTGRHSSQELKIKKYTFGEIIKPFEHIINALQNREMLK
ncbi:hypothetical protein LB467_01070 [Salegentibacter sp. JZCK2]|uniref:hypothetical protein n=1 Tax=Salegentibacter tibetensis TaxID=2873600 RepID=UPI001CCED6DC|nr:hypothetical protein [Salegentibacter tibetensis]MBZ9728265.1 hypothetical protein [Salegentibacter tibetensis]